MRKTRVELSVLNPVLCPIIPPEHNRGAAAEGDWDGSRMGGRGREGDRERRDGGGCRAAAQTLSLRSSQSQSVSFVARGRRRRGAMGKRVNKIEFENAAETEAIVMQNGMSEYISRLVALRTLFESTNQEITRSEFETFSSRLFERHPGMLRISWLPRVNRKERAEYEAAAATDGVSGYRIKSLQGDDFATAPQADEYFPVFYSTQPKTSSVYGMDYATVPERRAALERARDNDRSPIRTPPLSSRRRAAGARRARCHSRLRQGNLARGGRGPAPQSRRASSSASSTCRC